MLVNHLNKMGAETGKKSKQNGLPDNHRQMILNQLPQQVNKLQKIGSEIPQRVNWKAREWR